MLHFFTNSLDPAARRSACGLLNRKGQQGWAELTCGQGKPEQRETERRETEDDHVCHPIHKTRVSRLCFYIYSAVVFLSNPTGKGRFMSFIWAEWRVLSSSEAADILALTWRCFLIKIKSFSGACCNKPPSVWVWYQADRCIFVDMFDLYPLPAFRAVTSSWRNKADRRPSPLLSVADQWERLLTGSSLCSMIRTCVVSVGASLCVHMWEGRSGGCECVPLWAIWSRGRHKVSVYTFLICLNAGHRGV